MKKIYVYLFLLIMTASCEGQLIRSDLAGKPLAADDFTIIYNGNVLPCFMMEDDIPKYYGVMKPIETKDFLESYSINGIQQVYEGLETKEYTNGDIRIIYGLKFVNEDGYINTYFHINQKARTIRGVSVGDSINNVLKLYGENEFANSNKESWHIGYLDFRYEYYGRHDSSGRQYPFLDGIIFRFENGILLTIEYVYKTNNGP